MLTIALSAIAALLMLGPLGAVPSRVRAAGSLVYGACALLSTVLLAAGRGQPLAGAGGLGAGGCCPGAARRSWSCRSGCRGSARISALTRWPQLFSSWSI